MNIYRQRQLVILFCLAFWAVVVWVIVEVIR